MKITDKFKQDLLRRIHEEIKNRGLPVTDENVEMVINEALDLDVRDGKCFKTPDGRYIYDLNQKPH